MESQTNELFPILVHPRDFLWQRMQKLGRPSKTGRFAKSGATDEFLARSLQELNNLLLDSIDSNTVQIIFREAYCATRESFRGKKHTIVPPITYEEMLSRFADSIETKVWALESGVPEQQVTWAVSACKERVANYLHSGLLAQAIIDYKNGQFRQAKSKIKALENAYAYGVHNWAGIALINLRSSIACSEGDIEGYIAVWQSSKKYTSKNSPGHKPSAQARQDAVRRSIKQLLQSSSCADLYAEYTGAGRPSLAQQTAVEQAPEDFLRYASRRLEKAFQQGEITKTEDFERILNQAETDISLIFLQRYGGAVRIGGIKYTAQHN